MHDSGTLGMTYTPVQQNLTHISEGRFPQNRYEFSARYMPNQLVLTFFVTGCLFI